MSSDPLAGRRVGHYRLLERLGEGGMGFVYLAEREGEFRKRVAIKLVRFAMDGPEVLGRFHTERQTLAALNHPNIVGVLDGGATEEGLPYLVMDHVEGVPIDEYARNLGIPARLSLFLQVCAAVEYAHRNLIVHCDLKPTNILVTGDGVAKLLDFGIAKLLGPRSSEAGFVTQEGHRPFTPRFASPEQLLGKPVTTAADIYSLGVILYQLLAGRSPYRFETNSDAELVGAVCFTEPPPPSAAAAPGEAAQRLKGDLDAIVMKALRKEPENRYTSVEQLAADVQRHVEGLPVAARKGTLRYRATKFVLRNRLAVGAALVVALAVLTAVIGITWEAGVALAQRNRAERRFNDVRKLANFLLFEFHDRLQDLPGSTPAQEALVKRSLSYLDGLARESADDPALRIELAEAYIRLGDVQGNPYNANLGDTRGAQASYRRALELAGAGDPRAARASARAHAHLGDVLFLLRQLKDSTTHTRLAAGLFAKLVAAKPRDFEARMDLAGALEGLGDQLARGLSDSAGAREAFQKSLTEWEAALGIDPGSVRARRATAGLNMKLADIEAEKDTRAAVSRYRRALAILDALPASEQAAVPARRTAGIVHRKLGDALWELNDTKTALEHYTRATSLFTTLAELDPSNSRAQFDLVVVLNNAGQGYEAAGDTAAALKHYGRVADILERLVRTDPGNTSWRTHLAEILVRIGGLLQKTGQGAEAHRQSSHGLAVARELGEKADTPPSELVRAARLLVLCEPIALRDPQTAARYAQRAVDLTKGADAYALDTLAEAQLQAGNKDAARAAIDKGLSLVPPAPAGEQAPWLRRLLEAKQARVLKMR